MIKLLKCEFRKFKSTYINSLSLFGMLFPIVMITLVYIIKKDDFIKSGAYNWENFYQPLMQFFGFLLGPIITSFIAVFSIFYEYQQKTIKNLLASPFGRLKIILSKLIYVSVFVLLQYVIVAVLNILCALLLGFDDIGKNIIQFSGQLILAGFTTLMLVPLMVAVTLLFRSFIPSMVITVVGTITNIFILQWGKSYIFPWAIPADFALINLHQSNMNVMYPLISACLYFAVFMLFALVYFKRADQSV